MSWRLRTVRTEQFPTLRDIVKTTMHHRSSKVAYRSGAIDRIVGNAPLSFKTDEQIIDYLERAILAEEMPIHQKKSAWLVRLV